MPHTHENHVHHEQVGGQATIELLYSPHGPVNFCFIREETQLLGLNLFMHLASQQETFWHRHIGTHENHVHHEQVGGQATIALLYSPHGPRNYFFDRENPHCLA